MFYGFSPKVNPRKKIMNVKVCLVALIPFLHCCKNSISEKNLTQTTSSHIGNDIQSSNIAFIKDVPLPIGFCREVHAQYSFAEWLQNVPIQENRTVYLFDGTLKLNQEAQYAVLDVSVGTKNLQQCADAVMRLRAEYLFENNRFEEIKFRDNDNKEYIINPPYTKYNFKTYLDKVFGMCGSASLSKQLKTVQEFANIKGGDVLIRGGFPGHAVIVMDVAKNEKGQKIYLLAQSYMPAQDIHLLKNFVDEDLSPWYLVNDEADIATPEYNFKKSELKAW